MRKTLLTLLLAFALCGGPAAARRTTVVVKVPGTLAQLIPAADKYKIKALTLRGALDGSDLRYLREMAGSDDHMRPTPGRLTDVDLSDVTFTPGGAVYIYKDGPQRPTSLYTLPKFLFRMTRVERVVLPHRTDTVATGALEHTRLRRIVLPSNTYISHWAFSNNPLLEEVVMPDYVAYVGSHAFYRCNRIAELTFHHVGHFSEYAVNGMADLERVDFLGTVGCLDCHECFADNNRLRQVRFGGPILSTQGQQFAVRCPRLTDVSFEAPVANLNFKAPEDCPNFRKFRLDNVALWIAEKQIFEGPGLTLSDDARHYTSATGALYDAFATLRSLDPTRQIEGIDMLGYRFFDRATVFAESEPQRALAYLEAAINAGFDNWKAWNEMPQLQALRGDSLFCQLERRLRATKSYLSVLRAAPAYARPFAFTYAEPSDSGLQRVRDFFNVDSIAGEGDEISRIKRLMYWVHDHIRHDGSSPWPDCPLNAVDLYQVCQREKRGLNCRFLATMLNEMYLAAGFKARFLTCQSKEYRTDPDCHVINAVWSRDLNKWVWMDPSFAAYVTDENGTLLHPGEVRERLIDGRPLVLNDDANWNHESKQTKADYLENYMAKNLYLLSAHAHHGYETEGHSHSSDNPEVTLVPQGFRFWNDNTTSDPAAFWQAPE